jgi:non-specific serine/threonine protein kinase/serine/threonine-protein kinase
MPADFTGPDPTPAPDDPSLRPTVAADPADSPAIVIDRYKLLHRIAEGGMGEVWLSEQTEPVRRRVALKLLKAGLIGREAILRFESERQALALMDHPAIAKVLDGGSTPSGAPVLVMEYVAGTPITEYCDRHTLSIHERLDLFIQVCEGVQHAHQKAIIHRDLKPSNILVTEVSGQAAPKIIDFGIAKALTQKLTAATIYTRVGTLVGTPEYMSPEQALSSGEDIDTRTDVYSLGIVLYELLAGAPPIELRDLALDEFLRRLRDLEPPKPSTQIRAHNEASASEVCRKRRTEPRALIKQLHGDLDAMTLKALEKDRSRRYASASDLAADIRRHLNSEPVVAVPPSPLYRAGKFARRYRAALTTAIAFVVVLITAATVSVWQSVRATTQRYRADQQAAVAQAVNDFLQHDLLAQASAETQAGPERPPDPDLKVRTALDRAAAGIEGKFRGQPLVEASIRQTIGETYLNLGLLEQAQGQLERAVSLHAATSGEEELAASRAMSHLAEVLRKRGRYAEAEPLLIKALAAEKRLLGNGHTEVAVTMNNLGLLYGSMGLYARAEPLLVEALAIQRRVLGEEHLTTLEVANNLAMTYGGNERYPDARRMYTELLQISRRTRGADHPRTLDVAASLAALDFFKGAFGEAERTWREGLEAKRRILGPEHPETLDIQNNLATAIRAVGRYSEAEHVFREVAEIRTRVLGPEHPATLASLHGLAWTYQYQGRFAEAEPIWAKLLEIRRRVMGADHPDTLTGWMMLALVRLQQGRFAVAESTSRELLTAYQKSAPDNWRRIYTEAILGASLAEERKYEEAEPILTSAYDSLVEKRDSMLAEFRPSIADWGKRIVAMYQRWGRAEKAAEWKEKAASPSLVGSLH